MNPNYGDFDPYHMATSAMDEAVRNAVAVGADPSKLAVLDNFCWGNTEKPDTLGTLVRAAIA
jgi:phosphoribosylformylglycinamidine synthase